jgi:serine protease inhibitor
MKTRMIPALAGSLLLAAMFSGVFAKEKPPAPPSKQAVSLATADNTFGIGLFKRLHKDGENTFISPTSIAICMQMARQAAGGETRAEMDTTMGLGSLDAKAANKDLIAYLTARKGVKLSIANSLWADPARISLNEEYVKEVEEYFGSGARAIDFKDPKSVDVINGWISDKTEKLITDMLDEISADAVTYLINAIYFKGEWTEKFDKAKTTDAEFHLADGTTSTVKMMSRKDDIQYGVDADAQWVKLPYGEDKQAAMWIVLPREGAKLGDTVAKLDTAKLKYWREKSWEREGTLKLPRFTMRYKEKLNESLKAAGINKAFDPAQADFTRLGETEFNKIYISRVLHEAVVIVNEEGTEAAAATIIEMGCGGSSRPPKPWEMTCDRPFLFLITDEATSAVLFVGTCFNPESK